MSKSEICIKLKHVINKSKLRENIISTLLVDKLIIKGNFFTIRRADGDINTMPGYLKAFPTNNLQDQKEFARLLAKYSIHFDEYEESFKMRKTDVFPRTLTLSDIKHSSWLFSFELADIIKKNKFLQERILLDPSAVIVRTDGKK